MIKIKRVYDPPSKTDGTRLLVERLWPRGMKKEAARLDGWLRNVAPSTGLRKWFSHDPAKWAEFQRRYHLVRGQSRRRRDAQASRLRRQSGSCWRTL